MFGSDWPVCLLASPYAKVKQVIEEYVDGHATEHKDKIFGGNAIRFYGLEALAGGSAA
jgi:L-fuconolactonase